MDILGTDWLSQENQHLQNLRLLVSTRPQNRRTDRNHHLKLIEFRLVHATFQRAQIQDHHQLIASGTSHRPQLRPGQD